MKNFPLIDANLLLPDGFNWLSETGCIWITTNTVAPWEAINSIPQHLRLKISVIWSLITNRDWAERVILNSLAHPSLTHLILFWEETWAFRPSTNILKAIMYWYKSWDDHQIKNSVAIWANYPNINENVLEAFRQNITLLPIFKSPNQKEADSVVMEYLEFIKSRIPELAYNFLLETNTTGKILYDKLTKLIDIIPQSTSNKTWYTLDAKDFSSLQPPKIFLEPASFEVPNFDLKFEVKVKDGAVFMTFVFNNKTYWIIWNSSWQIAKTFASFTNENNLSIPALQQLILWTELSRAELEIVSDVKSSPIIKTVSVDNKQIELLELTDSNSFSEDKEFYYKIFVREKSSEVAIQCLAYDKCIDVFELVAKNIQEMILKLAELNRFADYDGAILHRIDTWIELVKAFAAKDNKWIYIQDGKWILRINENNTVLAIWDAGNFLWVHKALITRTLGEWLQEMHADEIKWICRATTSLWIYRWARSLSIMPAFYQMWSQTTQEIRDAYKEQLLRKDNDWSYSYWERTRTHFWFDQLLEAPENIKNKWYYIIQRFDPTVDMWFVMKDWKEKSTKDPCLTHDIYFVQNWKLQSFHIARAHNLVNAYPENIFWLHDAYDTLIAEQLWLEIWDTYMLSSRANILLLNEEMKAKAIINEPSKPYEETDKSSWPFVIKNYTKAGKWVSYVEWEIQETTTTPENEILEKLLNYKWVDEIEKVITYIKKKWPKHNNPLLTDYYAEKEFSYKSWMPFLQINAVWGKIYATWVFLNRDNSEVKWDILLVQYIATRIAKELNLPLGKYLIFNIN